MKVLGVPLSEIRAAGRLQGLRRSIGKEGRGSSAGGVDVGAWGAWFLLAILPGALRWMAVLLLAAEPFVDLPGTVMESFMGRLLLGALTLPWFGMFLCTRLDPFLALRMPGRRALLLARIRELVPALSGAGVAWAIQMGARTSLLEGLPAWVPPALTVEAFLSPFWILITLVAYRLEDTERIPRQVLVVIVALPLLQDLWPAVTGGEPEKPGVTVFFLAALILAVLTARGALELWEEIRVGRPRPRDPIPLLVRGFGVLLGFAWLVAMGSSVGLPIEVVTRTPPSAAAAVAVLGAVALCIHGSLRTRDALARFEGLEVPRRKRPWSRIRKDAQAKVIPFPRSEREAPRGTWRGHLDPLVGGTRLGIALAFLLVVLLTGVAAAKAQGAETLGFAVVIGLFAPRLVDLDHPRRAWLLGMDLKSQEIHDLKALLLVAMLPWGGLLAAWIVFLGPSPHRWEFLTLALGTFLFRGGARGWVRHLIKGEPGCALLLGCLVLVAAGFLVPPAVARGFPRLPWLVAGSMAVVGTAGLVLHLATLQEDRLLEEMRRRESEK